MISDLKKEIEDLNFRVELKDKYIEEITGKLKKPVPNENAQPSAKPRSRPWALGNATLPNRCKCLLYFYAISLFIGYFK
uniref:Uncharacterized protein n=1 Tax=Panagrolaimus davidi TaxID=227884 RepID=A0A914QCF9_9BILA